MKQPILLSKSYHFIVEAERAVFSMRYELRSMMQAKFGCVLCEVRAEAKKYLNTLHIRVYYKHMAVIRQVKLTRGLSCEMDRREGRHHYVSLPKGKWLYS
jgi:hypothetical protein